MIKNFYKRYLVFCLTAVISCIACACVPTQKLNLDIPVRVSDSGLYVHFLDVGQGDAILVNLPDGKVMMIDSGDRKQEINEKVSRYLKANSVTKIDYFILTHPDSDHVGGAKEILENFNVEKVYLPKPLFDDGLFPYYSEALEVIEKKGIDKEFSKSFLYEKGDDYQIAFLSPLDGGAIPNGTPTSSEINNLSSVIYLEYKSVRFLFTGDVGAEIEKEIVEVYTIGLFDVAFLEFGIKVNLENLDFLKVSHHGARDATCAEFVNLLCPKNAVISVSGDNNFGHPNTAVLARIFEANKDCMLYRTDVNGTITVHVSTNGTTSVIT